MPKLTWDAIVNKHPAGHLVVGVVDGPAASSSRLLGKLLRRVAPRGDYSLCILKERTGPTVHVVFERKDDADKFAQGHRASAMGRYPGWASQRSFSMGKEARRAIAGALNPIKKK